MCTGSAGGGTPSELLTAAQREAEPLRDQLRRAEAASQTAQRQAVERTLHLAETRLTEAEHRSATAEPGADQRRQQAVEVLRAAAEAETSCDAAEAASRLAETAADRAERVNRALNCVVKELSEQCGQLTELLNQRATEARQAAEQIHALDAGNKSLVEAHAEGPR